MITSKLDTEEWNIQVAYGEIWLDANSYWRREQQIYWLREQNIEFKEKQRGNLFMFYFKREEDSTLFTMRWG